MRIAVVSEHASPLAVLGGVDAGGQNAHVAQLSLALARLGHEVRVYTRRDSLDAPTLVDMAEGVEVVHVTAGPPAPVPRDALLPYMRAFSRALVGQWRDPGWKPDVVHAHYWMSGLAATWAAEQWPVPVVLTYHALGSVKRRHQGPADTSPPDRIASERALGHTVDRVVAQCRDEVAELVQLGVPRRRISTVPSGVDVELFRPDGPAVPHSSGRERVLSVGRLVPRKGFFELVEAIALVPDAECVIVGGPPAEAVLDDPVAQDLRALADQLGISDRVHLAGSVPPAEMPSWYRSAAVVACAPWYEPFGLTALEAMACGVPVVATAVGGLTDTVADHATGVLVPPRDPRALAVALHRLLADPARRAKYGGTAVDRARRRYSWRRTAAQLSQVYQAVRAVSPDRSGPVTTAVAG